MSNLFVECGEALYGPRWQTALAADLGVADRTIRRWVAGTHDVPRGVYINVLHLLHRRASQLDALADRLKAAA